MTGHYPMDLGASIMSAENSLDAEELENERSKSPERKMK